MKNNEGARTYTSLWLFTDKYCIECKEFLSTNNFDITPYDGTAIYCSIISIEFNFVEASEKSQVNIHCSFGDITCDLIATEQNCIKAFEIYKKYFVANLKGQK